MLTLTLEHKAIYFTIFIVLRMETISVVAKKAFDKNVKRKNTQKQQFVFLVF